MVRKPYKSTNTNKVIAMKKAEIIKEVLAIIEANNWEKADNYFSEDFFLTGPVPEPISKAEFYMLQKSLLQGIPDFKFNLGEIWVEDDKVHATVQITGTHTNDLEIPIPGIPKVKATNKKITMPREDVAFSFKKDLINKIHVKPVLNGGIMGLLNQLGVEIGEKHNTI